MAYLLGRDHNADLFDGLGELVGLHGAAVVEVEVLESAGEDLLLGLDAGRLLLKLVLQLLLETARVSQFALTLL